MKKCFLGLISFVLVTFSGCASLTPSGGITSFGQTDHKTQQTIEGNRTIDSFVVFPIGMGFGDDDKLGLKIIKSSLNDNKEFYFFTELHVGNWKFLEDIAVKFDEKTYRLHDNNPTRKVQSGSYVIEYMQFSITPEMLKALLESSTFTAELYNRVVSIDGEELQKVKEFCNN